MKILFLIPARGGSKGIPGKNIKSFLGKPLIQYSIELARIFVSDEDICVSTDNQEIANCVSALQLKVPFIRPDELSLDHSGMYDVIMHALRYYEGINRKYDVVILLQPTSPLRTTENVKGALLNFRTQLDAVVSVKRTTANPYFKLFEETDLGYLEKCKKGNFTNRQSVPDVWELNGAIYVYNVESLKRESPDRFLKVKKYVMADSESIDIDSPIDWEIAELLAKQKRGE